MEQCLKLACRLGSAIYNQILRALVWVLKIEVGIHAGIGLSGEQRVRVRWDLLPSYVGVGSVGEGAAQQ